MLKNEQIRSQEVVLITQSGENIGSVLTKTALEMAREAELDLVLVSPNSNPPVARIMNFSKFKYERERKEKEAKKNQKKQELKEMKFRLRIDEHDFQTKVNRIREFLSDNCKVRVVVMFLGRDIMFKDKGEELLNKVISQTSDIANVTKNIKMNGRDMDIFLDPDLKKNVPNQTK
ncbi:MAG TPA: translation initiation factor IF-3 [Petrotogaceae bacterium]|nr:translation initiation factor IF-3 [Petrotogaceae bacterium]HPO26836.1 translation initiation factor IF-3 [Petrotogaceae bacterium]